MHIVACIACPGYCWQMCQQLLVVPIHISSIWSSCVTMVRVRPAAHHHHHHHHVHHWAPQDQSITKRHSPLLPNWPTANGTLYGRRSASSRPPRWSSPSSWRVSNKSLSLIRIYIIYIYIFIKCFSFFIFKNHLCSEIRRYIYFIFENSIFLGFVWMNVNHGIYIHKTCVYIYFIYI